MGVHIEDHLERPQEIKGNFREDRLRSEKPFMISNGQTDSQRTRQGTRLWVWLLTLRRQLFIQLKLNDCWFYHAIESQLQFRLLPTWQRPW